MSQIPLKGKDKLVLKDNTKALSLSKEKNPASKATESIETPSATE